MNFVDRVKIAWDTFRRLGGIELPDAGRSSDESLGRSMSAFMAGFGSVSPVIDFEMLKVLKCLWLYNPDFSQYIANVVNLGNPGHQLSVEARNDATIDQAINRLNESSSRIYLHGVGVDGLLNQYLTSVAWSGAVSSEDVVNFAARRVEKVVLVPVEQIRFRYNKDLDTYDPYQQTSIFARRDGNTSSFGLLPLNQETYKYYALSTVENSPYAKPPGTAAVEPIVEAQKPLMENIRYMAQKFGLLGLVTASVVPPSKKPNETDAEYQMRAKAYLSSITKSLEGNFNKGLLVTYRDQKLEHTSVSENAKGVYDVNRISEEQVFSGMAAMPGFHGRTDSTTETFADVVYYLLTAQVGNMQRVVKRRHERTCRLDLRLGGIEVDSVSLAFDKAHSRNAKAEAETDEIKLRTVIEKVKSGLIDADAGAQELGEESWHDVELLFGVQNPAEPAASSQSLKKIVRISFDKSSQRYKPTKNVPVQIWSGDPGDAADNVVPIKKKAQRA